VNSTKSSNSQSGNVAYLEISDDRLARSAAFLCDLVRIPSYRGVESAVQARIAQELAQRGLQVSTVPIDPLQLQSVAGFSPASIDYSNSPNIVGVLKGSGGGRSLALNFHADTAPPGPIELWERDPFGGELIDGWVHGRGAWDDKAGCALAMLVLDLLLDAKITLKGDLILQSVVEDEHTGNGTLAVVAEGFKADGAIVLDGGYGPTAIVGHPGYLNFKITVYGKPAPSCRSELGENAIEKMIPILQALRSLETVLNDEVTLDWVDVRHPVNFNIGTINGGSWTGSVAEKCVVEAQMSFVPPFTITTFKEKILAEVFAVAALDAWSAEHMPIVEFVDLCTDALVLTSSNELMSLLDQGCKIVFKENLTPRLVTGWCDLRHFSLHEAVPSCLFGPGKGSNAHRPNESFEVAQLRPHAQVLVHQILNWCETTD